MSEQMTSVEITSEIARLNAEIAQCKARIVANQYEAGLLDDLLLQGQTRQEADIDTIVRLAAAVQSMQSELARRPTSGLSQQ